MPFPAVWELLERNKYNFNERFNLRLAIYWGNIYTWRSNFFWRQSRHVGVCKHANFSLWGTSSILIPRFSIGWKTDYDCCNCSKNAQFRASVRKGPLIWILIFTRQWQKAFLIISLPLFVRRFSTKVTKEKYILEKSKNSTVWHK